MNNALRGFAWLPALIIGAVVVIGGYLVLKYAGPTVPRETPSLATTTQETTEPVKQTTMAPQQLHFASNNAFTVSTVSGPAPLKVTFSNIVKSAGDEDIVFGDGSSASEDAYGDWPPKGLSYTYASPGTYTVTLYRHLPTMALGSVVITVTGTSTQSISGLSKYTDTDFGFSFWYQKGMEIGAEPAEDTRSFPGGTVVKAFTVGGPGDITITEVHSPALSITDTGGAGPFGPIKYFFDPSLHLWMTTSPEGTPIGGSGATTTADISRNTMGGLHMFGGTSRFDTTIIPLSAQNFVVIRDGGGVNATYLANTVVALDPSVATPQSQAQQTAILETDASGYAGQ